jgi:hypothetical protein
MRLAASNHRSLDKEAARHFPLLLLDLRLANRDDPITELIAKAIVNVTATGERSPILVKERAINALAVRRPTAA